MSEKVIDTHIRIAESSHEEMLRLAREHKRSLSKEIELAIELYIRRSGKQ